MDAVALIVESGIFILGNWIHLMVKTVSEKICIAYVRRDECLYSIKYDLVPGISLRLLIWHMITLLTVLDLFLLFLEQLYYCKRNY